jgi:hypothetical protein
MRQARAGVGDGDVDPLRKSLNPDGDRRGAMQHGIGYQLRYEQLHGVVGVGRKSSRAPASEAAGATDGREVIADKKLIGPDLGPPGAVRT